MYDIIKSQLGVGFIAILSILVLLIIFVLLAYRIFRNIYLRSMGQGAGMKEFTQLLNDAGYLYDPYQGIFYSKINAWQKKFGYCRLYDEAAAPSAMIIDSEPISFNYAGKKWLIQLWKGQYYLNTGAEIGIYLTDKPDLAIPNLFNGTFYRAAGKAEQLYMSYYLIKNGKVLFGRSGKHWWLTGFKTGEFSETWELSMYVRIVFKDPEMCCSFIRGMRKAGYQEHQIRSDGIAVEFMFDKPHSAQPLTRTEETDWIVQRNNERICNRFMEITEEYDNWEDKLKAIREKEPFLYDAVITLGKTNTILKDFDKLKQYI
ncbi:MAG: DUF4474 domain-containing protein [Eubacteriales bacterium]|nr:DUF4474 domain-containing protein [Eubacteriales bacterium]